MARSLAISTHFDSISVHFKAFRLFFLNFYLAQFFDLRDLKSRRAHELGRHPGAERGHDEHAR